MELDEPCHFQHDGHITWLHRWQPTPVCASWQSPGRCRPRTAVPMPANQYACLCIGVIRCDDVTGFQDRTVVCFHVCILVGDGRAETFEFPGNVRAAKTVGFRVRYARPERALCSRIGESTVCIEFRCGSHRNAVGCACPVSGLCPQAVQTDRKTPRTVLHCKFKIVLFMNLFCLFCFPVSKSCCLVRVA